MAQATNTTLGEIVLSGDLTGDAFNPELRASGVIPGVYSPVQRLSVDSKGRVTSVGQIASSEIIAAFPPSPINFSLVKIGEGFSISSGNINSNIATDVSLGIARYSSTQFTLNSGEVSLNLSSLPAPVGNLPGFVKLSSSNFSIINNDTLSLTTNLATTATAGIWRPLNNISVASGVASLVAPITPATNAALGAVSVANSQNLTISNGLIDIGSNVAVRNATNAFTATSFVTPAAATVAFTAGAYNPDFRTGSATQLLNVTADVSIFNIQGFPGQVCRMIFTGAGSLAVNVTFVNSPSTGGPPYNSIVNSASVSASNNQSPGTPTFSLTPGQRLLATWFISNNIALCIIRRI